MKFIQSLAVLLTVAAPIAANAKFPDKPIRVIVPVAAGSTSDIVTRLVAEKVSQSLGQSLIIENRPGGDTTVGMGLVARAKPDGYTLGAISTYIASVNKVIYPNIPYDAKKDFAYVGIMASGPVVLGVNANMGIDSLADLIAYAKKHPGRLNYSTASTTGMIFQENLRRATGIDATQIPYKGNSPEIQAVAKGEVAYSMDQYSQMKPFVQAKQIKLLAVLGPNRFRFIPDVPSMKDLGYNVDLSAFFGIVAPAGTAPDVVQLLNNAVNEATASSDFKEKMSNLALDPQAMSPTAAKDYVLQFVDNFESTAKAAGLKPAI